MQGIVENKDILKDEVYVAESLLIGILWNNPTLFSTYTKEKLSINHLGNKIWKFYLGLAREMYNKGFLTFDEITVAKSIRNEDVRKLYKKYGEYETVEELMIATKDMEENFHSYYEEVKKYSLLRGFYDLFGDKIFKKVKEVYDYHEMSLNKINDYWTEKLMKVQMDNADSKIKEYNLLDNLDDLVEKLDSEENMGMPFYELENFNEIMNGWAKGTVYLLSAFSGMGKSSFVIFGIIMACIKNKEKLVVIANEMDIEAYQKLLLITVMGNPLHDELYQEFGTIFNRSTLERGKFSERDKKRIQRAIDWIKENVEDTELIKFIPIEHYTMDSVEQSLRYYKHKGYDYAVIDTCKPSENRGNKERWVQFVDDFETIYKLSRKDNLNMGLFCTVQNADSMINTRYLDYSVIGDGKKIKNTVDFCCHIRTVHPYEKQGEHELVVKNFNKKRVKLNPLETYYLVFVSKNRRGQTNFNNLGVLVLSVDLNTNTWKEIGWAEIANDIV